MLRTEERQREREREREKKREREREFFARAAHESGIYGSSLDAATKPDYANACCQSMRAKAFTQNQLEKKLSFLPPQL